MNVPAAWSQLAYETCAAPSEALRPNPDGRPHNYEDISRELRDGDLVLFKGTSAISRFITAISKEDYSHIGMVLWWGGYTGRLMCVEAVDSGVRAVPLSMLLREYEGRLEIHQLNPQCRGAGSGQAGGGTLDPQKLVSMATKYLGRPYSPFDLFRIGLRHLFKRDLSKPRDGAEDFFCSEYIHRVYREAGLDLERGGVLGADRGSGGNDDWATPGSIASATTKLISGRVPVFQNIGELRIDAITKDHDRLKKRRERG